MLNLRLVAAVAAVGRVVPILHGWHLDDLLRDTPFPPPSVIGVWSSAWCGDLWRSFGLDEGLPSRAHLFLGEYDLERTAWFDVSWKYNVTRAPALIFLPQGNPGSFEVWEGGGDWRAWLDDRLRFDGMLPGQRVVRDGVEYEAVNGDGCGNLMNPDDVRAKDSYYSSRDQDTTFTHSALLRQPPVVPAHGPAYATLDMPDELKERLWAFYRKYDARRAPEVYSNRSTGINQHVVSTTMVSFDHDMEERDRIALDLIQPLVEEWAGQPLVHTSFYGIREYYRGAELRMHVDRVATHVFSVIINLHQENMDSEWPLEVINFDGSRGSVVLQPGQLLFYQSAKLIHGRPTPLNGSKFVNCFCHFKPREGWDYVYGDHDILYFRNTPVVDYKVD